MYFISSISRQSTKQGLWTKIKDFVSPFIITLLSHDYHVIYQQIFEILYDFTDESRTSADEDTEDTPPLQAKK